MYTIVWKFNKLGFWFSNLFNIKSLSVCTKYVYPHRNKWLIILQFKILFFQYNLLNKGHFYIRDKSLVPKVSIFEKLGVYWYYGDIPLQVDFLEPRNLTGLKTQGRDMVPQWVTAFYISYSQDGDKWNILKDKYGSTIVRI